MIQINAAASDWPLMGSMTQASASAWSEQEALVAILLSAATADARVADTEREELLAFEHRAKALRNLGRDRLRELNRQVTQRLRYGEGTLAQACAVLPEDARAPVFAQALDLMLADGELREGEADFVNTLVLLLDLDSATVEPIVDVIVLKNRL